MVDKKDCEVVFMTLCCLNKNVLFCFFVYAWIYARKTTTTKYIQSTNTLYMYEEVSIVKHVPVYMYCD